MDHRCTQNIYKNKNGYLVHCKYIILSELLDQVLMQDLVGYEYRFTLTVALSFFLIGASPFGKFLLRKT